MNLRIAAPAILCTVLAACSAQDQPETSARSNPAARALGALTASYPWWLEARYDPMDTVVASLPIRQIDTLWDRASILSTDLLTPRAQADPSWLGDSSAVFEHDGDFNGDGQADRALVGVYRDRTGDEGRFLLILTTQGLDAWTVAFLQEVPGTAGFSVLLNQRNAVVWADCMECDRLNRLTWQDGTYVWDSPEDPPSP